MKSLLVAALLAAAMLAGCGERSQGYRYENGRYAGKPDTPAWQHERFNDSRKDWQEAMKTRTLKQSEYTRMTGGS